MGIQYVEDIHSQDEDSLSSSSTITDLLEDVNDDASSSSPTIDVSHLPIKKGLSKFYGGKSQSYTSLASVKSVEDLPKKEKSYNVRMKMCKSFADGLDGYQNTPKFCTPNPTISKRMSSRGSFLSNMVVVGRNDTCNRSPISVHK